MYRVRMCVHYAHRIVQHVQVHQYVVHAVLGFICIQRIINVIIVVDWGASLAIPHKYAYRAHKGSTWRVLTHAQSACHQCNSARHAIVPHYVCHVHLAIHCRQQMTNAWYVRQLMDVSIAHHWLHAMYARMGTTWIAHLGQECVKYVRQGVWHAHHRLPVSHACHHSYCRQVVVNCASSWYWGVNYAQMQAHVWIVQMGTTWRVHHAHCVGVSWKDANSVTRHQSVRTVHRATICWPITHANYVRLPCRGARYARHPVPASYAKMGTTWV